MSLLGYIKSELTRSYLLEHDQERYTSRREKMYTFMRIPRELEKFMSYGFFHCLDSFLFIYTFLPIRVSMAIIALVLRTPLIYLGYVRPYHGRFLYPAEIIDVLKVMMILLCCYAMSYVDTSMLYHIIKSQSVIKLYLMYNMIEVADRLFSAFGQDTIDALFWTATEPKDKKREHIGVIPHFLLALGYVFFHALLVLLQATTLNVAINSSNKALLTIMMSNNFVELKGSVFKKFDKNNLFQVSCSDVRERFHLFALLFVVVMQTMKEYSWREESFWSLAPDCLTVLGAEVLVDWIKHAFITRFNELSADVYKDYAVSLAYDLAQTKQKQAFSDHSDIVSRRMGFIPMPLGVVMLRVVYTSVRSTNPGTLLVVAVAYICLFTFRILGSIVMLGKACDLIDEHKSKQQQQQKKKQSLDELAAGGESQAKPQAGHSATEQPARQRLVSETLSNTPCRKTLSSCSSGDSLSGHQQLASRSSSKTLLASAVSTGNKDQGCSEVEQQAAARELATTSPCKLKENLCVNEVASIQISCADDAQVECFEDTGEPFPERKIATLSPGNSSDTEIFDLPSDRSSERFFLYQNSMDDRADVLLTNMNRAVLEDGLDEEIIIEDELDDVCNDRIPDLESCSEQTDHVCHHCSESHSNVAEISGNHETEGNGAVESLLGDSLGCPHVCTVRPPTETKESVKADPASNLSDGSFTEKVDNLDAKENKKVSLQLPADVGLHSSRSVSLPGVRLAADNSGSNAGLVSQQHEKIDERVLDASEGKRGSTSPSSFLLEDAIGLSPDKKVKSLSSPDLIRSIADDEDDLELRVSLTSGQSEFRPAAREPNLESNKRYANTAEATSDEDIDNLMSTSEDHHSRSCLSDERDDGQVVRRRPTRRPNNDNACVDHAYRAGSSDMD